MTTDHVLTIEKSGAWIMRHPDDCDDSCYYGKLFTRVWNEENQKTDRRSAVIDSQSDLYAALNTYFPEDK